MVIGHASPLAGQQSSVIAFMESNTDIEKLKSAKTYTTIIYALYAASFFTGITVIIGIILNYLKKDDVAGTFLESHFKWQMRTFWFGFLWSVIGGALVLVFVGYFVLVANGIWLLYRIIKGFINMNDDKPMYPEKKAKA